MIDRGQPDSALHRPNRQSVSLSSAKFLTLFLSFISLAAAFSENASGRTLGSVAQQQAQTPGAADGKSNDENEAWLLEPGKAIKRELAGGQSHTYRISLNAGQFLKVIVEQHGIDLVVQLSGPSGEQIAEFDSESRSQGQESAPYVAEADGEYRLKAHPQSKNAQVGSYEIRIEELRAATDDDRALHEASILFQRASKLRDAGKYEEALPSIERSLEIRESVLGPEHRDVAETLNGLGALHWRRGEYAKAEPLFERALAIRERALGLEHPDVAQSLTNLATIYRHKGDYAKAEQFSQRALNIKEKALGSEHLSVAISLNNLASIYYEEGHYAKAESLIQRALAIREKTLGPEHLLSVKSVYKLAILYAAKGDFGQALTVQARANSIGERNLAFNLGAGSERQKLAYLALLSKQTDFTLWLHGQALPRDPQALDLAFTTLLRRKGRGLDVMAGAIANLRRHATPEVQALFDQLAEARSRLAALTLRGLDTGKPDTYRARLKPLEDKADELESALSARSSDFGAQRQPVTLTAVQSALPAGGALVEFAVYTPQNPQNDKNNSPLTQRCRIAIASYLRSIEAGRSAHDER
jgi:tetratricopeptide (TPR) repeat protein